MRFLATVALAVGMLLGTAAAADPPPRAARSVEVAADRYHVGAETHWTPSRFDDRLGLGLGWRVPRRWYDADGVLLTERSLLDPGHDLERPGLYVALKF